MTINDFNVGETWINNRSRKVEIVAVDEVETDGMPLPVAVIAYRYHGMGMIHLRAAAQTAEWKREVE